MLQSQFPLPLISHTINPLHNTVLITPAKEIQSWMYGVHIKMSRKHLKIG
jgi:hypothetical protein